MARIKVAKQSDLDQTNTNVQDLQSDVQDPASGLNVRTQQNAQGIQDLYNIVGPADDTSGLRKRIYDNEFSIADPSTGLIKKTDDINDVVGTSASTGLQGRVGSLEDDVKSVGGLNDQVTDLQNSVAGLSFSSSTNRYSQSAAPTVTASDDRHLLTKKDGDDLYGTVSVPVTASAGAYNSDTTSDTWNDICEVGNIKIQARNPTSGSVVAQVVNSTGSNMSIVWHRDDEGTLGNGSSTIGNNNVFTISKSTNADNGSIKTLKGGVYTTSGVNTEAYTFDVYARTTTNGIRIICSITGKF